MSKSPATVAVSPSATDITIAIVEPDIRIVKRGDAAILQQKWTVKTIDENRRPVEIHEEWRDVPVVKE